MLLVPVVQELQEVDGKALRSAGAEVYGTDRCIPRVVVHNSNLNGQLWVEPGLCTSICRPKGVGWGEGLLSSSQQAQVGLGIVTEAAGC